MTSHNEGRFTRRLGTLAALGAAALLLGCGKANEPAVPTPSPAAYEVVSTIGTWGFAQSLDLVGDTLFVAENSAGVGVYDFSTPSSPVRVDTALLPARARLVRAEPAMNALFVNSPDLTRILWYDSLRFDSDNILGSQGVRDLETRVRRDMVETQLGNLYDTLVVQALIADISDGVQVATVFHDELDVVFFGNLIKIRLNYFGAQPLGVAQTGSLDTIAVGLGDVGVGLADIEKSTAPDGVWLGFADTPGEATHLAWQDGFLYVADGIAGLSVIDATDPSDPSLAANWDTTGLDHAIEVAVDGSRLALVDEFDGVYLFDVSDPVHPVKKDFFEVREPTDAVFLDDGLLIISSLEQGLTVLRLHF